MERKVCVDGVEAVAEDRSWSEREVGRSRTLEIEPAFPSLKDGMFATCREEGSKPFFLSRRDKPKLIFYQMRACNRPSPHAFLADRLSLLVLHKFSTTTDFQNTQGIIFVVDSNDRERVSEAREELQRMLNEDELRDALLLVFANKQDLPNAMNAAEITDKLGLHSLRQRQW